MVAQEVLYDVKLEQARQTLFANARQAAVLSDRAAAQARARRHPAFGWIDRLRETRTEEPVPARRTGTRTW